MESPTSPVGTRTERVTQIIVPAEGVTVWAALADADPQGYESIIVKGAVAEIVWSESDSERFPALMQCQLCQGVEVHACVVNPASVEAASG